jgi:hypothetical protein
MFGIACILARRKTDLEKRLGGIRKAIGRLVRATGGKPDGALSAELRALNEEYAEVERQVTEAEAKIDRQEEMPTERDVAEALRTIEPLWAELFPAEKERIVHLSLVEWPPWTSGPVSRMREGEQSLHFETHAGRRLGAQG